MRNCVTVLLAIIFASFVAAHQGVTAHGNSLQAQSPDPGKLLQESSEACRAVRTIEYEEEQEPKAAATAAGEHSHRVRARIRQARAAVARGGFLPGKFAVEGEINHEGGEQIKFAFTYDGKTLRVLDTAEKLVRVVRSPAAYVTGQLLGETGTTGMVQFTEEQPFKDLLEKNDRIEYEGTAVIQGVNCHVVGVTSTLEHPVKGKSQFSSRWFIGVADKLPRGREYGNVRKTVRIVRVNAPLAETAFVLQPQAGYGEKLTSGVEPKRKGMLALGTEAPDWKLTDDQGRTHTLSDYRGKVVLMDFWGTWCLPCRITMPGIQAIHEKFKGRGVAVLGITLGGDEAGDPVAYMKSKGFTYGLLLKGDEISASYNVGVLPALYLIGDDGKIIHAEYGLREGAKEDISRMIEGYLKARKR